jgi:hypothetical protein
VKAELERRESSKDRILAALQDAGARGVTNHEFNDGMRIYRYGARIEELRKAGHAIASIDEGNGCWRFVLTTGPRPGQPGYLASLPVVASIDRRLVKPTTDTDPAATGRLF